MGKFSLCCNSFIGKSQYLLSDFFTKIFIVINNVDFGLSHLKNPAITCHPVG